MILGCRDTIKLFKNARQFPFGYAYAPVGHLNPGKAILFEKTQTDFTTVGGVLHGIRQQIENGLLYGIPIHFHWRNVARDIQLENESLLRELMLECSDSRLKDFAQ